MNIKTTSKVIRTLNTYVFYISFCLCIFSLLAGDFQEIVGLLNPDAVTLLKDGLLSTNALLSTSIANNPYFVLILAILAMLYFRAAIVGSLNVIGLAVSVLAMSVAGTFDLDSMQTLEPMTTLTSESVSLFRSLGVSFLVIITLYYYLTSSLYLILLPLGILSLLNDHAQPTISGVMLLVSGMMTLIIIACWPKNQGLSSKATEECQSTSTKSA